MLKHLIFGLLLATGASCNRASCARSPSDLLDRSHTVLLASPLGGQVFAKKYTVKKFPNGLYGVGQMVALYGSKKGIMDIQPVGVARVLSVRESSLDLVALWVDESHKGIPLEVRDVPHGHHFGSRYGQILSANTNDRLININMGKDHGVSVGDTYHVLGNSLTDTDLGGRSLGRETVGVLQVVELNEGGQTAKAELLSGSATANAYVEYSGHEAVGPRPVVTVLVTRFQGDPGESYSHALASALERAVIGSERSDIRIKTVPDVIQEVDGENRQVKKLGLDYAADIVVWGKASERRGRIVVRPRISFIGAKREEESRIWDPEKVDGNYLEKDYDIVDSPDAVTKKLHGLASYLAGRIYYTDFENEVDRFYALAISHLENAISLGDEKDARNARLLLFNCWYRTENWTNAELVAQEIETEGKQNRQTSRQAQGLYLQALVDARLGSRQDALLRLNRALQLYETLGDSREKALTIAQIADIHYLQGNLGEALHLYQEGVVPIYERLGDLREKALTMGKIANIYYVRGKVKQALHILETENLPVFKKLRDSREIALTMRAIADIYYDQGKEVKALQIYRTAVLPTLEALGDQREKALTMGRLADYFFDRGDFGEALRIHNAEELPVYEKLGDAREKALTLGKVSDIYIRRGRLEEALVLLQSEALPVLEKLGDIRGKAGVRGRVADIYYARGQVSEALRIRRSEQLPIYERLGDIRGKAQVLGELAAAHLDRGEWKQARHLLKEKVLPLYETLGDARGIALTMGRFADLSAGTGSLSEALRIRRSKQLPIFHRLEDAREKSLVLLEMAFLHICKRDPEKAMVILQNQVIPTFSKHRDIRKKALAMELVAVIYTSRGEVDIALRILQTEVLPPLLRLKKEKDIWKAQAYTGLLLWRRNKSGDREQGTRLLQQSLETAENMEIYLGEELRGLLEEKLPSLHRRLVQNTPP